MLAIYKLQFRLTERVITAHIKKFGIFQYQTFPLDNAKCFDLKWDCKINKILLNFLLLYWYTSKKKGQGVEISKVAETELANLVPDVEKTAMLVREITSASAEQSSGANQIQNSIQLLNNVAQKNALISDELNAKAKQLSNEANKLRNNINYFRL